ncbi:MAG: hypothetical protein NT128_08155 [Proteobacteria bacterium]|nr:hypothetical protein [Pseudomonadota bacterium]
MAITALRFQLDFLFNGKEYYTSPIMEKDTKTIGLDELYKISQNVDPTLRQEVTDFFKEKNLTSFSITHTLIGVSARLN